MNENSQHTTMYIKNRQDSSYFQGLQPCLRRGFGRQGLQLSFNLKEKCSAIACFSYTERYPK